MIAHRVEVSSDGQDVKCLDERVVENEHKSREPPSQGRVPEEHLANVAHIQHFRMSKTKFPIQ